MRSRTTWLKTTCPSASSWQLIWNLFNALWWEQSLSHWEWGKKWGRSEQNDPLHQLSHSRTRLKSVSFFLKGTFHHYSNVLKINQWNNKNRLFLIMEVFVCSPKAVFLPGFGFKVVRLCCFFWALLWSLKVKLAFWFVFRNTMVLCGEFCRYKRLIHIQQKHNNFSFVIKYWWKWN